MMARMAKKSFANEVAQIVRKSFAREGLKYFEERGITARLWQDEADGLLHILAKPDLNSVHVPANIALASVTSDKASWYDHWWARFLRWMDRRIFRWKLPKGLHTIAFAYVVNLSIEVKPLPTDILERIKLMKHYLFTLEGIRATKLLMGVKAHCEFEMALMDHYPDDVTWGFNISGQKIFDDLEIQINPFLAEDAILVC